MITLTIDGRRVTVPPETSVLEAARWLGIRIPTMCHVPGVEPAASCFLCAVQIEGRRTLSPSCAMPAAEGMVVATDSADVRVVRKTALELLLSDHAGECVAPCAARCPAGLDIPGFVNGIATGDTREAMQVLGRSLALPGSLGRICPRLCEQACRRSDLDQSLAIGALHRYAADQDRAGAASYLPARAPATGKAIAIVGAGPAGLAAAWYLLQKGHVCTLFDAHPLAGGMLRYGIPSYRLPKDALDAEIAGLHALGAHFRMGARWGEDFTLAELRGTYDAVFVATGAQHAQGLRCPGAEHALAGIGFLEQVAQGNPPPLGDDVVVFGGGNTAVDCARSAVRLGARNVRILYRRSRQEMPCLMEEVEAAEAEGVQIDLLVAPVRLEVVDGDALAGGRWQAEARPTKACNQHCFSASDGGGQDPEGPTGASSPEGTPGPGVRPTHESMPLAVGGAGGSACELTASADRGSDRDAAIGAATVVPPWGPERLLLTCRRMTLGEPDASGRRSPVPVVGSEFVVACSTAIAAIGQSVERALAEQEGLGVTAWGIAAEDGTLATNLSGVFAGGDAVLGADLAVRAVAAGRIAATSIHQYLTGQAVTGEPANAGIAMQPVDDAERAAIFRAIESAARVRAPEIPMERRVTSFDEVEQALPLADAVREARRCLSCGCRKADCCLVRSLATEYDVDVYRFAGQRRRFSQDLSHPEIVYEPGKCISCNACVRIAAAAGEELGLAMIGRGFDVAVAVPFGRPLSEGLRHAAQRCAAACPTGALALRTARSCDVCELAREG
jgi:NADPH-dependent glutamate synthase beta subunit-like oxidoreductase/ferredoxin